MSLPKTSIPERRTSGQLKPRKLKPNDNPLLVAIASFLGFSGLTTYSILTGNIAYFSLVLRSSGGVEGWLLRIFIILVSFLSTLTGLGVIFIPRQTLAALRLMGLAGLGSLVAGLL
ncbi:MAG: hypothetical protein SW833_11140, partial [Cyanobacteriota bacterium]|nr:hypothetical protein [Cyanobacteriota bacterium]